MAYTKVFERPYSGGWVDYPSETTPISADALNEYDTTFQHVEDYLEDNPISQTSTIPTASEDEEGNIYQYVGETTATYTQGYFYQCVSDGAVEPTYNWVNINVQPDGTGTIANDVWDSAKSYALGDVCIYNNSLYMCISANIGQAPTNTSYWKETDLSEVTNPQAVLNTDFITLETGFSIVESRIYKQGYRVFGDVCIKATTAYTATTVTVGTIKTGYRPARTIVPLCLLGNDEWGQQSVGYCFIGTGGALLFADQNSTGNKRAAKVHIDYITY